MARPSVGPTECYPNRTHIYGTVGCGGADKGAILGILAANDIFEIRESHYGIRM